MKDLKAVLLASLLACPAAVAAKDKLVIPPLAEDHWNNSRTLQFRTPAGWSVSYVPGNNYETTEARGDGMMLRLLRWNMDMGLDSLHVDCMLSRLAGPMEMRPGADYEYDFIGGEVGGRRALDSAFVVEYDALIDGDKKWRQRNLTIVGGGESVCIITYVRNGLWKKSTAARKLLTSLAESVKWP